MDDEIKLPGSSFEELAKIIQGYAQLDRETSLDDISRTVGIGPTIVSGNNGFLLMVGIIQGGMKKTITPLGKKLGRALSHEMEDEIRGHLKEVVDNSEFLKNLVSAVRIRKGMDEGALRAHVAYSAGQGRTPRVTTGAGTVVEFLKRSGAIEERDGKFVAVADGPIADASAATQRIIQLLTPRREKITSDTVRSIAVSIQIEVKCEPKDLDGLGEKLRKVVADFGRPDADTGADDIPDGEK